jgi:CRISPR/Cas system-associated protein endoribonuclease Cas2
MSEYGVVMTTVKFMRKISKKCCLFVISNGYVELKFSAYQINHSHTLLPG